MNLACEPKKLESKRNLSIFLVFLFLLPFISGGCSALRSENDKLIEEVTDVNAENEKLKKELNDLRTENSNMYVRLAQLNLEISALQNEIQNLQRNFDTLKARVKEGERKRR